MANDAQMEISWDAKSPDAGVPRKPQPGTSLTSLSFGDSPLIQTEVDRPDTGTDLFKYGRIARNPVVKSSLDTNEAATFLPNWSIAGQNNLKLRPEFKDIDDMVIADINRQILGLKDQTFEMSLRGHLRNGFEYGLCVLEWEYADYMTGDKHTVLRLRPQAGYDFDVYTDEANVLEKLLYYGSASHFIEGDELSRFAVTPFPYIRNGNWYGESLLQSVHFDVQLLEELERCLIQGANLLSIRPILLWYQPDQTDAELTNIRNVLLQMTSGAVAQLPSDAPLDESQNAAWVNKNKVEVLDDRASADGQKALNQAIDLLSKRIVRAFGIPDDLGFSSSAGSLAKAKEEMNLYIARIIGYQEFVEHAANQVIIGMVRYNWQNLPDGYVWPRFSFDVVKEDRSETIVNTFLPLVDKGIIDAVTLTDMLDVPLAAGYKTPVEAEEITA